MAKIPDRWHLTHEGCEHVVEIKEAGLRRSVTWRIDGAEVAGSRTSDKRLVLDGGTHGAVGVRLPEFAGPARRVTWHTPKGDVDARVAAHAGLGGVDLDPEPGSKAAAREAWIRVHPRLHVARRTAGAVAGVLLPMLALWLWSRMHLSWPAFAIPWPDWRLPRIPWPAIPWPGLPWPDLSIPWPDWDLPPWVHQVREKAKYVWPVLVAFVIARAEVNRRRAQDERKHGQRAQDEGSHEQ